ncbi:MAG: LysM peptidoglycan-binding domain-containing protein [Chloroflexi bacterium]|nr:LysM peptidoglycan-binding domain-containing protein [Chloroflexota bacterium]
MFRAAIKLTLSLSVLIGSMVIGALFSYTSNTPGDDDISQAQGADSTPTLTQTLAATETIPPYTPLPSLTPSQTLKPPPTFEPPTPTPTASTVPSQTPTPTVNIEVSIPGLRGAESPTPTSTPGCEPRDDWQLTYTVQMDDSLSSIADRYGTWVDELAEGNCITDKNLIVIGQVLRVPGDTQPTVPEYECVAWEALTPFNGTTTVPTTGSLTFNWRGPQAPKYLLRIYRPDGTTYEQLVELRMNDTVDIATNLPMEGTYTWYVYPLDENFAQITCLEGGPWTFYKAETVTSQIIVQ